MAVETMNPRGSTDRSDTSQKPVTSGSTGRRVLVGANVLLAVLLVVAIVGVLQWLGFRSGVKADMTSSGINSLSEGTERLLRGLNQDVRLTSLYFETDIEEKDQQRYRRAVEDLLGLYSSSQRGRVIADSINPLRDHEKLQKLTERVRAKTTFKEGLDAHRERLERYKSQLDLQIRTLLKEDLDRIAQSGAPIGDSPKEKVLAPVEDLLRRLTGELEAVRGKVDASTTATRPQESEAVEELKNLYRTVSKALTDIGKYGREQLAKNPGLPEDHASFLREAGQRYAAVVSALEEESTKLQSLEPLKVDELLREIAPNSNAIVVETESDARIVDFASVWPPIDPSAAGRHVPFKQRGFKGEEKITSAVLRATHKEQTAVVFVRYGGAPLFLGGFMPNQPPAPYARMKQQLEDSNFLVDEWDLKTKDTPPEIKPTPTRTIYVVLKPTPPERGPMGQPGQEPPFADSHMRAIKSALGENGRALFVAGWYPGPMGPIPGTYEFNDYLKEAWGLQIDTATLLIQVMSVKPGQYLPAGRAEVFSMDEVVVGDHDIVSGRNARLLSLPWCAPLEIPAALPAGVKCDKLVVQPQRDGVWGIKNLQTYQEQLQSRQYMTLAEGDRGGPFDLAAAAQKGDAKVVVVSSRDFADDNIAFASAMSFTPEGISLHSRNPGNVPLLINSLHWLNDKTDFMNIGKPIDAAVLEIDKPSTVTTVKVLTIFVWPVMALMCGGVVWWVRRR